jgi:hypothetical protein
MVSGRGPAGRPGGQRGSRQPGTHNPVKEATRYSLEEYEVALTIKYPMHLKGLSEMHDRLRPHDVAWDSPGREEVDRALMFLLAVMLFDIGMRIGMAK